MSNKAAKMFANDAKRPLVVVVPDTVELAAEMPLVIAIEVAVAFVTLRLPPVMVPEV